MRFNKVVIADLVYTSPPEVWTSEAIETRLAPLYERLKLPHGRLELMTGIRERRFWSHPIRPSEASATAGQKLLKKLGSASPKIDLLIHASVCRDRLEPSTAAYVHHLLHLSPDTQILDVSNACLGFLNAMVLAAGLIESGQIQTALIVSGENGRPLVEWTLQQLLERDLNRQEIKPFFANLTIGAGAVAALLCHEDLAQGLRIVGGHVATDSSACSLCEGGSAGEALEMQTDSEGLLRAGIALAKGAWNTFQEKTTWSAPSIHRFITHQVGKQHRTQLYQALQIDPQKDFSTFEQLGNIGSASLPITLAASLEARPTFSNEKIALLGIGSGLSTLMLAISAP